MFYFLCTKAAHFPSRNDICCFCLERWRLNFVCYCSLPGSATGYQLEKEINLVSDFRYLKKVPGFCSVFSRSLLPVCMPHMQTIGVACASPLLQLGTFSSSFSLARNVFDTKVRNEGVWLSAHSTSDLHFTLELSPAVQISS